MTSADVDSDGISDLLTWGGGAVACHKGKPGMNPPWSAEVEVVGVPSDLGPGGHRLAVGDIDGDLFLDLAVVQHGGDLLVLFGDGTGTSWTRAGQTRLRAMDVWLDDLTGDGLDDVITPGAVLVSEADRTFSLLQLPRERAEQVAPGRFVTTAGDSAQILSFDLNSGARDVRLHSLGADMAWTSTAVALGDAPLETSRLAPSPEYTLVGDVDGDGLDDLITPVGVDREVGNCAGG